MESPASTTAGSPADDACAATDGVSKEELTYEERRRARLVQNRMRLIELGLYRAVTPPMRKPPAEKRVKPVSTEPPRRSSRLTGAAAAEDDPKSDEEEPVATEDSFVPSALASFDCRHPSSDGSAVRRGAFHFTGETHSDKGLKKSYALAFHPWRALLAAGGDKGQAAVFGLGRAAPSDYLHWPAHAGWLSSMAWCGDSLLTSANDGGVNVWDTLQQRAGDDNATPHRTPKLVSSNTTLHDGGIFEMHVRGDLVLTCSKDASVSLARLSHDGVIAPTRRWANAHAGVVKSVGFRSDHVFASGSQAAVHVWDARSHDAAPSAAMRSREGRNINSVSFHPRNEHALLASGLASAMELFDVRRSDAPVARVTGHFPRGVHVAKTICRPAWAADGSLLLASGGGSRAVTLFDADDLGGDAVAVGQLGFEPTCFGVCAATGRVAVASGKEIALLQQHVSR